MTNRRRHVIPFAFLAGLAVFVFFRTPTPDQLASISGLTMGTSYQVLLPELPNGKSLAQLDSEIEALLSEMDKVIFSTYVRSSELSQLNNYPVNQPFEASKHLVNVLLLAADISSLSDGAFDVTVGPLVNLWGFGPSITPLDRTPSQLSIKALLEQIGHTKIAIDAANSHITKLNDVTIDLSAIAKGYAVDQLAAYFDELNVSSYFLEVGGELKIKGLKPGGLSWVPAIEAPVDSVSQVYQVFFSQGDSIAVAGSGDYRNYFEQDGVRYSHEIDPRTGYPIEHRLAAAYVIDNSAAKADALATAFMVMGFEESKVLAEKLEQAVYFIYKGSEEGFEDYASPQFAIYLED
ncbi:MAG: FAD:protein FMN transferase [Pseudohongiellaceae bacterium]